MLGFLLKLQNVNVRKKTMDKLLKKEKAKIDKAVNKLLDVDKFLYKKEKQLGLPEHGESMKKQSRAAKLDESLGMRKGKESEKKESYAARRHESEGMEHHEMAMHHLKKAHDHLKKHAKKK